MLISRTGKASVIAVAMALSGSFASAQESQFYANQALEIILPFSAGGGTDTFARQIAPFLQKYLGDGARVQVTNDGGAGGVAGSNNFALRHQPDGYTGYMSGGSPAIAYLLGDPAVRYDFNDMVPIVGKQDSRVLYVASDTNIDSVEDLRDADDLVYAGISATGGDLVVLLIYELLGIDVQTVLGYESGGSRAIAFETGESNIDYQVDLLYEANVAPRADAGEVTPILTFSLADLGEGRNPQFPEIPTLREVYEELHGEEPSGPAWEAYGAVMTAQAFGKILWLHDEAPEEAVASLRDAAAMTLEDPEYQAVEDVSLHVLGDEVYDMFGSVINFSPETRDWLVNFLSENYGVERLQ